MWSVPTPPDLYVLQEDAFVKANTNRIVSVFTPMQFKPNPAKKTLALIVAGQSNWTNVTPTFYQPNSACIQLSVLDGAFYPITSNMVGCSNSRGPGNISARLGDKLLSVNGGTFDNVVICCTNIGGTAIGSGIINGNFQPSYWGPSGILFDRPVVAYRRFLQNGITPTTPGVTFAFLWGQGEGDNFFGTSQATYAAGLTALINNLKAAGFPGRFFICEQTWNAGTISTAVENAQISVVDNVTIFSGGNLDAFGTAYRYPDDNTHFNDSGAAAAATAAYNAIHLSGTPF